MKITELTTDLLDKYTQAANADFDKAKEKGDSKRMYKRGLNLMKAAGKKIDNDVKAMQKARGVAEDSSDDIEDTRQFRDAIALAKSQKAIRQARYGKDQKFYADGTPVTPEEVARRAAERKARLAKKQGVAEGNDKNVVVKFSASEYAAMSPKQKDAKQQEWQTLKQQAKRQLKNFTIVDTDKEQGVAEGKITLSTDPNWYGAEVGDYKASGPVVNIPANQLVGFEPDDKMNQPASKANVEKIVAGLKQGAKLPPLLVRKYKNGYQVLDGHHRFWAYKLLGVKSIPAQIVPDSDIEEKSRQGVAEGMDSLDPFTRSVLNRMEDDSWLSAEHAYFITKGIQKKKQTNPEAYNQEIQRFVDLYKQYKGQQGVAEDMFGIDSKTKGAIQNVVEKLSDIPNMWDHKAQTFTNLGKAELEKVLNYNPKYIKYAVNLTADDFDESVAEERKDKGQTKLSDLDKEIRGQLDPQTTELVNIARAKYPTAKSDIGAVLKLLQRTKVHSDAEDRQHDSQIKDLQQRVSRLEQK